jgi:hypothetical protein
MSIWAFAFFGISTAVIDWAFDAPSDEALTILHVVKQILIFFFYIALLLTCVTGILLYIVNHIGLPND